MFVCFLICICLSNMKFVLCVCMHKSRVKVINVFCLFACNLNIYFYLIIYLFIYI